MLTLTLFPIACAHTIFLSLVDELVTVRKRILVSKADVSDAFRNVRVDPDQAHNFFYRIKKSSCDWYSNNLRMVGIAGF